MTAEPPGPALASRRPGLLQQIWIWARAHPWTIIPAAIILIIAVLSALPTTRYGIASLFLTQNLPITIADQQTKSPVSDATINLGGHTATTNSHGQASLHVPVGPTTLIVSKKYYETTTRNVLIGLREPHEALHIKLQANGRVVPVNVKNWITGQPVSNATIRAANTSAQTDEHGQATIVLPAGRATVSANITAASYNNTAANIFVIGQTSTDNDFTLTPSGQIYFLSNRSGKIDVVKTNLDGSSRTTVIAGTGHEDPQNTVLLASRDWKFLALEAIRDTSGNPKLYLINTGTGQLTTIESSGGNLKPIGWDGHYLLYSLTQTGLSYQAAGFQQLKSFNADSGQLTTLDQSQAVSQNGGATQAFANFTITGAQLLYTVDWTAFLDGNLLYSLTNSLRGIEPNGQGRKDYQTQVAGRFSFADTAAFSPNGFYYSVNPNGPGSSQYFKFQNNTVAAVPASSADPAFEPGQPTYLISPSGNQTLWSQLRDGQNVAFLGDADASDSKPVTSATDSYQAYGWFTDNYVLLSQNSDVLFIAPATTPAIAPHKISDYYDSSSGDVGYGSGYGGQ